MRNLYGSGRGPAAKLDLKDRKILATLGGDARAPLSRIAKEVGLSRDSVEYRINKYMKEGILGNCITVVRSQRMGYGLTLHLYLKLNNPSPDTERSLIDMVSEMPFTVAVWKFFGAFDMEVTFIAKDPSQASSIISNILSMAGKSVQDYELAVWTKNYLSGSFPRSFLKGLDDTYYISPRAQGYYFGGTSGNPLNFNPKLSQANYVPDSKDMKILKIIGDDARTPLIDIARKVGMSQGMVRYRLEAMKENLIVAFVPTLNYEALGYTMYALLLNIHVLKEEDDKRLQEFFYNNDSILWAIGAIGRFNVLVNVCCRKESEFQKMLNDIRHEFPESIKEYELLHAVEEYKYTYTPECMFR